MLVGLLLFAQNDVMAVCSVQIEITESGDRLTTSTATVVEPMLI